MFPPAKVNGVWPFNDASLRTSLEEARRHATLPQSWIQRENWEFETHRTASHLIHDRDPLYTRVFGEILTGGGVQPIRLPRGRSGHPRLLNCRCDTTLVGQGRSSDSESHAAAGERVARYAP